MERSGALSQHSATIESPTTGPTGTAYIFCEGPDSKYCQLCISVTATHSATAVGKQSYNM